MKIAIFHNYLDNIGGAELVDLTMARELNADIFTTNIDKDKIIKMGFEDVLPRIFSIGKIPINAPFKQEFAYWKFRFLNLKNKYDFYIIAGDWAMAGAMHNKPHFWYAYSPTREIWDLYGYTRQNMIAWYKKPLFDIWVFSRRILNKWDSKKVGNAIAISKNTQGRLKKYLKMDSEIISPPTETSKFHFSKTGDYWLSVNRLITHKRIDLQLKAFAKLPNEKLIIVGSYEQSRHFKQYAEYCKKIKPNNVEIKSWVSQEELINLYANCKGFITTSQDEDFGMNVIEAMASGKPVIAPKEGGYKETIINGKTGILIGEINENKLVDAIKKMNRELEYNPLRYKDACQKQARKFDTNIFINKIKEAIIAAGKPMMDKEEIKILEKTFLSFGNKKVNILEWGVGWGTLYFSRFLEKHRIDYTWLGMENSSEWYKKISNCASDKPNIKIILFEFKQGETNDNIDKYIGYPEKIGEKYDIILIDGRHRAECLLLARHLLKTNGIIFLHDAERKEYHQAMSAYPQGEIITPNKKTRQLWSYRRQKEKPVKRNNIALALFSFNRPQYLKQVLESIELNKDIGDIDFYFFQDGYINKFSGKAKADKKTIEKSISLWEKSKIPNKHLIKRGYNVGIGINQFEAKVFLFEEMGYEQVMFFEDDMVLSKNYIRLLRVLLDQFENKKHVGAVMCHGLEDRLLSKDDKINNLYKLTNSRDHLWGWAMWKDRWLKIKPDFLKYYEFIKEVDYKKRPTSKILDFYKKDGIETNISSQDRAIYYSMDKNRLIAINTIVNRSKYIGKKGEHMQPRRFKKTIYGSMIVDEFKEDGTIGKFDAKIIYR